MAGSNSLAPLEGVPMMDNEASSAPAAALQEALRQAAEMALFESRAAYARAKDAADQAAWALEASFASAAKGAIELNSKALDALRANFDAGVDFAKAAINSKSAGELVSLQSDHTRKQAEAFAIQAREFGELAQKIAAETAAPLKTQIARTFRLPA